MTNSTHSFPTNLPEKEPTAVNSLPDKESRQRNIIAGMRKIHDFGPGVSDAEILKLFEKICEEFALIDSKTAIKH